MGMWDTVLEVVLLAVLVATLVHAMRLQRALGSLRADRAAMQDAVQGFDGGTRQAEAALGRMQTLSQDLSAQHDRSTALRNDLEFLSDRGEGLADRLDALIRTARGLDAPAAAAPPGQTPRSLAERSLLVAMQGRR